jgi:predicted small lipoprotein YifL
MRNTILLLIVIAGLCTSCGKKGPGYFSIAQTSPPLTGNDTVTRYYYFNNIIIYSNTNDTFNLPGLSQGIIDSGTVAITFRSSIVWLNTWYPLPIYTFPDGSTVTVNRVVEQPGKIVLTAIGPTTPAMNYSFSLSIH